MKKFALLVIVALLGCASTPIPDPDNGVSNASYRLCIERSDTNVAQITTKLIDLKALDQAVTETHKAPLRPASWWDVEIREAQQTERLLSDTLKGATK